MTLRGWRFVGIGFLSLGLHLACSDHKSGGGGGVAAGGTSGGSASGEGGGSGAGRGMSPPAVVTDLPRIEGFAPGTVCEGEHWCWYNPTPVGNGWLAAASAGQQDIWIAGTGNGLRFDGRAWSVFQSPLLRTTGIWAASPGDIWMVGSLPPRQAPRNGIAHGDGQTFQIAYDTDESSFFQAVWGSGPTDVWAVGLGGNVAHFDGQRWTKQNIATNTFTVGGTTIDGSGPDDVWVGDTQGVYRFDGTTWTQVPEFAFQLVFAVAVQARNDVWVSATTGGTNTLYHYDGTSWTATHSRSNDAGLIIDIDARASDDAWAVGTRSAEDVQNGLAGVLLHWDGTSWTAAPEPPVGVRAVLSRPNSHIAVGDAGQVFQLSTGPAATVRALNPSPVQSLQGIWGTSPSDMWAVGNTGIALHHDGTAIREERTGVQSRLLDVWGSGPGDVWAVGEQGVVLRRTVPMAGPSVWRPVASGTTATLRAVFTAARDDVWIGGDGGLFHSDGGALTPVTVPGLSATSVVYDIHGLAPDDIWAAGRAFVSHYDGTSWSPAQIVDTSGVGVARIWMVASNDVWGDVTIEARDHGPENTWHFDGTAWTPRFLAPAADRWMFPVPGLDNGLFTSVATDAFSFSRDDVWAVWSLGSIARRAP